MRIITFSVFIFLFTYLFSTIKATFTNDWGIEEQTMEHDNYDSVILHYDEKTWNHIYHESNVWLNDIYGFNDNNIFAVGNKGIILHYDGKSWTRQEQLAQYLVHGVDVWLNNPLPPLEASGTSGMKASLNGVPQLSMLDGWWMEGFNGKNGWSFGDDVEKGEDRDFADANALYTLMENEIIPSYYRVDDDGVPRE